MVLEQTITSNDKFVYVTLILSVILIGSIVLITINYQDAEGQLCLKTCKKRQAEEAKKSETLAFPDHIFIGIRVSKACEISGTCPSYKSLGDVFDNSNKYLSGDFFFNNKTQRWDREPPIIYNSFELYKITSKPNPVVIWVNPDDYTWDRTRQIMIESEFYRPIRQPMEENMIYAMEGREIQQCHKAIIGWKTKNGTALLGDTVSYFMSNCKEPLQIEDQKEIFINSTIFPNCDKDCFHLRYLFGQQMKAFHQVEKEYAEKYIEDPEDIPQTIKEKIEESLSKAERRAERLKELEDIQECEKFKIHAKNQRTSKNIDCEDEDVRDDYLEEKRIEYPEGIKSVQKFRGNYTKP